MVTLYVGGKKVSWADAEKLFAEPPVGVRTIELRNDAGQVVARVVPQAEPTPNEPLIPWDPSITREELDKRANEPGLSIDEVRKRLGWE